MSYEQIDAKVPEWLWELWPKTNNGINLLFFHNIFIRPREWVAWYTPKVDTIFFTDNRYKLIYAIWEEKYHLIKEVYDSGFNFHTPLDYKKGLDAFSLATEWDKLEILHYLELLSSSKSSLSQPPSTPPKSTIPADIHHSHKLTPLMIAVNTWNVKMIEYLISRKVDPLIKDKYNTTAKQKAEVKNLNTISNILGEYEKEYSQEGQNWEDESTKEREEEAKILEYEKVYLNSLERWKGFMDPPSKMLKFAPHPFIDYNNQGYWISMFDILKE